MQLQLQLSACLLVQLAVVLVAVAQNTGDLVVESSGEIGVGVTIATESDKALVVSVDSPASTRTPATVTMATATATEAKSETQTQTQTQSPIHNEQSKTVWIETGSGEAPVGRSTSDATKVQVSAAVTTATSTTSTTRTTRTTTATTTTTEQTTTRILSTCECEALANAPAEKGPLGEKGEKGHPPQISAEKMKSFIFNALHSDLRVAEAPQGKPGKQGPKGYIGRPIAGSVGDAGTCQPKQCVIQQAGRSKKFLVNNDSDAQTLADVLRGQRSIDRAFIFATNTSALYYATRVSLYRVQMRLDG